MLWLQDNSVNSYLWSTQGLYPTVVSHITSHPRHTHQTTPSCTFHYHHQKQTKSYSIPFNKLILRDPFYISLACHDIQLRYKTWIPKLFFSTNEINILQHSDKTIACREMIKLKHFWCHFHNKCTHKFNLRKGFWSWCCWGFILQSKHYPSAAYTETKLQMVFTTMVLQLIDKAFRGYH